MYGPFFNSDGERKIAVGTGIDEEFFRKNICLHNQIYAEDSNCQFKDLEITSMKDFYVDGIVAENVESVFKVGSEVYKNCKSLYLLKKYSDLDSGEIVGLYSGNNRSHVSFNMVDHLMKNYPSVMSDEIHLESLETKVDFGGLIALFRDKEK